MTFLNSLLVTAWNILNGYALTAAIGTLAGARLVSRSPTSRKLMTWADTRGERLRDSMANYENQWLMGGLLVLLGLYAATLRSGGAYDEEMYALHLREPGFYYNWNHFIPHVVSGLLYKLYHLLTGSLDSLTVEKVVNAPFGVFNAFLFYRIARWLFPSESMLAFLFTMLYGVSFGVWKFATSGEVYAIMMTSLLVCLLQFVRMDRRQQWGWGPTVLLALLANGAVLSHNATALIAFAYGVPLLIRNRAAFWRFVLIGFILFVSLQTFVAATHGKHSFHEWFNHNFYPVTSGRAVSEHWLNLHIPKNIPIVLRDGTLTIMAGLELNFLGMSRPAQAGTLLVYAACWMTLVYLAYRFLIGRSALLAQFRRDLIGQVILGHWLLFAMLNCVWNPGFDKFMHWLIPYFLFLVLMAVRTLRFSPVRVSVSLVLLVPLLLVSSWGTSAVSSSKLRTLRFPEKPMDRDTVRARFKKGDVLFMMAAADDMVRRYFFPYSAIERDSEKVGAELHGFKGRAFFHNEIGASCRDLPSALELERVNVSYSRIVGHPKGRLPECPNLTAIYVFAPPLRVPE